MLEYVKRKGCRYFYKTIAFNNFGSVKVAENSGFEKVSEANKIGIFHQIIPIEKDSMYLYRWEENK